VNDVLNTPDFEAILCDLSRHSGIPVDKLRAEAALDLNEMATRPGKYTVAGWDRFCRWLARAYQLDFDPNEVRFLQELNRESALIFLPNHRSYLDPLVLRSALARFEFPPNSILGGSNLALWPLSTIGQRSGIVFIRREFRDDPLYRAVLKTYLAYLIQHRKNLEWYIEGGRTRTGKLRPTRYGDPKLRPRRRRESTRARRAHRADVDRLRPATRSHRHLRRRDGRDQVRRVDRLALCLRQVAVASPGTRPPTIREAHVGARCAESDH
jgi:hypothetical protein